jgi:hypothetical protein
LLYHRYSTRTDAVIGCMLLIHGSLAALAALTTLGFLVWSSTSLGWAFGFPTGWLIVIVGFVATVAAAFALRSRIIGHGAPVLLWTVYFALSVICLFISGLFFEGITHDVALIFFASHGRFGCINDGYVLTSATIPWIAFATEPLAVVALLAWKKLMPGK